MEIKKGTKKSISTILLIILTGFQGISALPSGWMLMTDPTGNKLGTPISMLDDTPFKDFFIPGLFLFFMLGIFPVLILYGLIKKKRLRWANKLNLYKDQHWSWTFSYYLGLLLVLWINMQLFFIKGWSILHFIYSMLGVLIIIVTHLPNTKKDFNTSKS